MANQLFFGDNLELLRNRDYFPNDSIDLIYLDPPFNSDRDYNLLFKESTGLKTEAQIVAFKDTWDWGEMAEASYRETVTQAPEKVARTLDSLLLILGRNSMMAYLAMMTARLVELHRVLKPTGSLYLHCDPTASHYLKLMLDAIFDVRNFRNEIIWRRTSAHNDARRRMGKIHDNLLHYTKSDSWIWNEELFSDGTTTESYWDDIPPISSNGNERRVYPTQKPIRLLERIINISSNPADRVLDPFCGSGTSICAAQKLGRAWIGIDMSADSLAIIKNRLSREFRLQEHLDYSLNTG